MKKIKETIAKWIVNIIISLLKIIKPQHIFVILGKDEFGGSCCAESHDHVAEMIAFAVHTCTGNPNDSATLITNIFRETKKYYSSEIRKPTEEELKENGEL